MLLVADVGNTNTKIGVFDRDRLLVSWVLTSRREQTADEYGVFIETLLLARGNPARSQERLDEHAVLVGGLFATARQDPRDEEPITVEDADLRVGVADVSDEEHGSPPA